MTDLAITGGTVATASWAGPATVLVDDGRIEGVVGVDVAVTAARTIDATGRVVLPGGVDPHCHIGQPLGDHPMRDDFDTGTMAALAGGTTTVIDFALPPRVGVHPLDILDQRLEQARSARIDHAFHGCVNPGTTDVETAVIGMVERGVRTVKLFTTYRDLLLVDDDVVARVMATLRDHDGLTYVHAEANPCVEQAQQDAAARGRIDASGMAETRPESCERNAVARVLDVAERVGAPVYFVHQSTPEAVDLVVAARQRGVRAHAETCPHYLFLDDTRYAGPHPERWVCCPPLRRSATVAGLRDRVAAGFVDTVGSDHCCYDTGQKASGADDVRVMPNGLPGIETRLAVVHTALVATGRIDLPAFVRLTSTTPARLNGLHPRKGALAPGADADLVVLDTTTPRRVHAADLHMATDYSPYEDQELTGWPTHVVAGGRVVVDDGELADPGPVGRHLRAGPIG